LKKIVSPVTFAQALCGTVTTIDEHLPALIIKGDSLSIKISQEKYEKRVEKWKRLIHRRLVMSTGDKPYTTKELFSKLSKFVEILETMETGFIGARLF